MKGLIWDDLGSSAARQEEAGSDFMLEILQRERVEHLQQAFLCKGVELDLQTDWDKVPGLLTQGGYSFAIFDVYQGDQPVGIEYAKIIRNLMRDDVDVGDPEFPIFLLSSEVESIPVMALVDSKLRAFSKRWRSEEIVTAIRNELRQKGRWTKAGEVLILGAGDEKCSLTAELKAHFEPLKWTFHVASRPPDLGGIREAVLDKQWIIKILRADIELEEAEGDVTHMARAESYVELGVIAALPSNQKKLIVLAEANTRVPSFLKPAAVISFSRSMTDATEQLSTLFPKRE